MKGRSRGSILAAYKGGPEASGEEDGKGEDHLQDGVGKDEEDEAAPAEALGEGVYVEGPEAEDGHTGDDADGAQGVEALEGVGSEYVTPSVRIMEALVTGCCCCGGLGATR